MYRKAPASNSVKKNVGKRQTRKGQNMRTYLDTYKQWRKETAEHPERYGKTGVAARQLRNAKHQAAVEAAWEKAEDAGLVRFRVEPDDMCDLDDLFGDMFDPDVHTNIKPERLAQERQREIDRVNRDGVWGIIGECKGSVCPTCGRGGEWTHGGSCWGFIGDDWKGDAEIDIKAETLTAAGIDY